MSRLKLGALVCSGLAQACGPTPAVAAADASRTMPLLSVEASARAPTVSAAWGRLSSAAWAAETPGSADLVAADPASAPTAVYDIMAHVVVLPDGARLEAHSGLRDRVDDPRFVAQRMRGATPPALYALEPRERPFHGVAALRLIPVAGEVFGRSGLLAHTYMLHGRPESNGCVVFRDYGAFLSAFREGRIKRLRVVPSVGNDARLDAQAVRRSG